jgi:hypothetical protein
MTVKLEDLLLSYRNYYGAYHHHKEQMAYGATVLYLSAASAIILKGTSIWPRNCVQRLLAFEIFILAFLFTMAFVIWQLNNRKLASNIVFACTTLLQMRLSNNKCELSTETDQYKNLDFPKALSERLRALDKDRKVFGSPRASEIITYSALILWTILASISIFSI